MYAQHLKEYIDICGKVLLDIINKSIINSDFEEAIKLADITPMHKNDDVTNKLNDHPISGLPSCSKIFEKIIQRQIASYRKGYNVQHALIALIEKVRISLEKKGYWVGGWGGGGGGAPDSKVTCIWIQYSITY